MMKVIPAPLEKDISTLLSQIKNLSQYFKSFQIDIADGEYVPNKTVQLDDLVKAIDNKELQTTNLLFDFHLMVKDYEKEIEKIEKLRNSVKIQNIFIHYSVFPNYQLLTTHYSHFTFGIVLNPEDSVDEVVRNYELCRPKDDRPLAETMNCIQIMSVTPGFQGSQFIPETLNKIEQLRTLGYKSPIYLDGGINLNTLPVIKNQKYTPDFLCIGSYLTKSSNISLSVKNLNRALGK